MPVIPAAFFARLRFLLAGLTLALMATLAPTPAQAATCEASMSDIAFGPVALRAGSTNRSSGTLTITCSSSLVDVLVGVCVRFGPGDGGAAAGNAPRYLRNGAGGVVAYQLRRGGFGAGYGTLNTAYLTVPLLLGQGQVSIPIYGEVLGASPGAPTGTYESLFSGTADISISTGVLSCDLLGTTRAVPDFRVSAEIVPSCELSVGSLDFGRIRGLGLGPVDGTGAIDVRCTEGTGYSVSLGMGQGPAVSGPTQRQMRNGGSLLSYGLYRDAGYSLPWGDTAGSRASATGDGNTQRFTVYGRIHQGQDTRIGTYTDNVVVTVNY
ncbi:Csu type fimbrial protein [Rhodalgimonas zhirmunskyi]|uniref:Spore coat U domain-containing protein n=1 Tax=Rhodalgimonas zhirmunskyi TaxID=2964767 RepID=A0AAJ1U2W7_9RHOB|nr:spore coat U domain-containing protein [Rhodoalgimonas zhirmunskyi]MDQ2092701.1 spore coat U domain-containing protein [Rhodoalgimonas zhirmunskyi]